MGTIQVANSETLLTKKFLKYIFKYTYFIYILYIVDSVVAEMRASTEPTVEATEEVLDEAEEDDGKVIGNFYLGLFKQNCIALFFNAMQFWIPDYLDWALVSSLGRGFRDFRPRSKFRNK